MIDGIACRKFAERIRTQDECITFLLHKIRALEARIERNLEQRIEQLESTDPYAEIERLDAELRQADKNLVEAIEQRDKALAEIERLKNRD